jgi:hypothetical protein
LSQRTSEVVPTWEVAEASLIDSFFLALSVRLCGGIQSDMPSCFVTVFRFVDYTPRISSSSENSSQAVLMPELSFKNMKEINSLPEDGKRDAKMDILLHLKAGIQISIAQRIYQVKMSPSVLLSAKPEITVTPSAHSNRTWQQKLAEPKLSHKDKTLIIQKRSSELKDLLYRKAEEYFEKSAGFTSDGTMAALRASVKKAIRLG